MNKRIPSILSMTLFIGLVLAIGVLAQGTPALGMMGEAVVDRWVIASGGGLSSSTIGVSIDDTFGQPIVGPASNGSLSLETGYRHSQLTSTSTPTPTDTPFPTSTPTPTDTPLPTSTQTPLPTSTPSSAPVISNVQIVMANVARYERFEVQFDVQTVATNLDLPYDPAPPPGVEPGTGVTVNGLFSPDGWATTQVQPAFYDQPYIQSLNDDKDHLTPDGAPRWAVRFAPQVAGDWQFRLCVTDALGTTYYPDLGSPALTFSVAPTSDNAYTRRGFLKASQADRRYFEFSDGSPFVGAGFNDGFTGSSSQAVEEKMATYEQYKMNFMRVWLSGSSINGSQWASWVSSFLPADGYLPGVYFNTDEANTYNGADFSMVLDDSNPCFFSDPVQGGIPVEPNTTYSVSAALAGVTGPAAAGDYGFVVKQAGWLEKTCANPGNGTLITTPVAGSTDWITLTGLYTTGPSQYWLDYLYLARQNATGGTVYIDGVRVWRTDDPARVNLLRDPNANSHLYFDPMNAAQWDLFIQSAEQHGVYLKLVIDEKNEWLRNHIDASGNSVPDGSNDNFYAAPGTKVRWLEQAWWRYIIARWGYSTAIHSFEYVNEGDPYNGHHHEVADSMALYFEENDLSQHMVTTSFWSSFPNKEFWSNPAYPHVDYTDFHAYISTGWGQNASFLFPEFIETDPAHIYSGNASARIPATTKVNKSIGPRGMVIQGEGEWIVRYWMEAENFTATCPYGVTGGMQRIRWLLDGGRYNGGREGVVPTNQKGQDFGCTSPDGTFGWTQFSSDRDRDGNPIPSSYHIVIADNLPHELTLKLENSKGTGGTAWIDGVELVSPEGKVQPVIGQFDTTSLVDDTAWNSYVYACVWGADGLVGAHKPFVRGENGIDVPISERYDPDLLKDTGGIWLHNNVWATVSACHSGVTDLYWWAKDTIPPAIYYNYLTFRNFMEDIPLNNGNYRDISTQVSNASLRVWGQRDNVNGRMHLWIQNIQHTWTNVIDGVSITPITGTVTILDVPPGNYTVQWWNTYLTDTPVFLEEVLTSTGVLTLTLPYPLADDVAVKITPATNTTTGVSTGVDRIMSNTVNASAMLVLPLPILATLIGPLLHSRKMKKRPS